MKKYSLFIIIALFSLSGCVKDEQPAPTPPPAEQYENIVINELMTKDNADPYFVDESGKGCDWIELYNKGNKAVNIAGMWVTDKPGETDSYNQIPTTNDAETTIPPKGFLVMICGAADANGTDIPTSILNGVIFIDMGLSSSSDNFVAIYDPEKVEVNISDDFNGLVDDKSFGRETDGGDTWITLTTKTPGKSNNGNEPTDGTLVINEFMCSNDTTFIPDGGPDDYPDWIEIYNTGDTPIDMAGWYVTQSLDEPNLYQIPDNIPDQTVIPGHGHLVLKADGTGEGLHLNFKLGSGGEDIGLSQDGENFDDSLSYGDSTSGGPEAPLPGTDFSSGRKTDGATEWVIFDPNSDTPPTPGSSNGSK